MITYNSLKEIMDLDHKTFKICATRTQANEFINDILNENKTIQFSIKRNTELEEDPWVHIIVSSDIAEENNGVPNVKWWKEHQNCLSVRKIWNNGTIDMNLHSEPVTSDTLVAEYPIKNGTLRIDKSPDPDYPGVDIEYIDKNEKPDISSRPRVLVECPHDTKKLRVLIWANSNSEDYSDCIEFDLPSDEKDEE